MVGGVNGQYFSDASVGSFVVAGVGWGWDVGGNAEINAAVHTGDGGVDSWSGRFDSVSITGLGATVSLFWGTPDTNGDRWWGVSAGVAPEGFGASYQITEYTPMTSRQTLKPNSKTDC